ncbi:MAG: hypothetical protein MK106_15805, partial [Mariniblastus sp.]|nr:hypothetical protein [Mariniblastus sp.]
MSNIVFKLVCLILSFLLIQQTSIAQRTSAGQDRLNAWEHRQTLVERSPFRDLRWEAMGPKFAGGRIESIDCPPGDLSTIYAGVGAGGIWKSTNGGLTWRPIFGNQSTYAIGDLAVAPSDPNQIWLGTGECHLSRTSYPGNGVYRSLDGGETWEHRGLTETAHIGKVLIDPIDPLTVYVAAMGRKQKGGQRGIYKTSNGGKTFSRVLYEGEQTGFVDIVMDPFNHKRLYATSWDRGPVGKSAIFRTDDSGKHWIRLEKGFPKKDLDRIAIDVGQSREGVVYSLVTDRTSPELARRGHASIIFRSDDFGDTWTRCHEGYVPTYVGWDFCDLRVAPDDDNRLYIGGLRLITSNDGGQTFEGEGGFAVNKDPTQVFRLHPHRGIGLHLDVHDIWIDPVHPNRILLGNDGGLFCSSDHGNSWLHFNNLPIAEFYRIHLDDQEPFHIWGGTQDNASFVGPSTARYQPGRDDNWEQVFLDPWTGGDGFATFPDPNSPTRTFYTQQNGDLKRSRLGQLRPEKSIRPRRKKGEPPLAFDWDTPFFASKHDGRTVLYCSAQCVFKSLDLGDSWNRISPYFGTQGQRCLAESPADARRLVVGRDGKNLHFSPDNGAQWTAAGPGLPEKRLRDINLSHHDPDVAYVALSGKDDSDCTAYLFKTEDFGKTWISLAQGLPAESVNAIEEDPVVSGLLYVGTDLGVFISTDHGRTWDALANGIPTAPVVDLEVHARDGKLVAATHGLSIYILDISTL